SFPFWSPDSRSIGFFSGAKLKRVDLSGGTPVPLAEAPLGRGGTWNADGTILYAPTSGSGLSRVSATGGQPSPLTRLAPQQISHWFPYFLPDGRNFLFQARGGSDASGIYLGSLDAAEPKRLGAADSNAVYLPPGRVAYIRQGRLLAQKLDLSRRELTGDPET